MNRYADAGSRCFCAASAAFCALWLAAATVHAQQVVQSSAVQKATASAAATEQAQRLSALAARNATGELVAELQRLAQDPAAASIIHEWLLDRGLHELSRLQPTPAATSLLHTISQRAPRIFVQVDPDHGTHAVPLYDPGATARFVLRKWDRRQARDEASAALAANLNTPIERFAADNSTPDTDAAKAGIVDAFRAATPQTLARYRNIIAAAMARGDRLDEIAAITAERLADADLYSLVMGHADAVVALDAMKRARTLLGDPALDVLIVASGRQDIASAALLEIGRMAESNPQARAHLLATLGDPAAGPSAAAALAALHDPTVAAEIGQRLRTSKKESERRQMALALKLDGSQAARAQLDQFVKTRSGSAKLRSEVRAWLAQ